MLLKLIRPILTLLNIIVRKRTYSVYEKHLTKSKTHLIFVQDRGYI